jgi:hypothetical protein
MATQIFLPRGLRQEHQASKLFRRFHQSFFFFLDLFLGKNAGGQAGTDQLPRKMLKVQISWR